MSDSFEPREFRTALGRFATGVTVITTVAPDGDLMGLTVNSFSSLSLDPPLVQWGLDKESDSFEAFVGSKGFSVNVLADDQIELSARFASRNIDRFGGIRLLDGFLPYPLIDGCTAHFECNLYDRHDGGDHIILIGKVVSFRSCERPPLLFFGGRYWSGPKPIEA